VNRFEDKVVLITGAAGGIGRATAFRLAEEGARCAIVDVNEEGLAETLERLGDGGHSAYVLDLFQTESIQGVVDQIAADFGKLDVLCNIAGMLRCDHTHEMALDMWHKVLTVNTTGTFAMCRAAIPHLVKTKGNIVNMSSTAAIGGHPWMAAYAASKGAILSMTRSMSLEYVKQGIRVNAILPGGIATDMHMSFRIPEGADPSLLTRMTPLAPFEGPSAAAAAVAFVASDDGRYMNGAGLRLDGGMLA
jgi:meso-butanediol dehydrogenase / (S,S)-butanediol dehydrogenase / diacetyl reductase